MKTYTGTKILNAMQMNRGDYNRSRGWILPAGENASDAGYLVECLDGAANTSAFKGYVSWFPADQFEISFIQVCTTDRMSPRTVKIAAEKAELTHKLQKLTGYIDGKMFDYLPEYEKMALLEQQTVMREYVAILATRLRA